MKKLNMPPIEKIPADMEISRAESDYLGLIENDLFYRINQLPNSLLLTSDSILCLVIIICRHNKKYPTNMELFIPFILKHNTQQLSWKN